MESKHGKHLALHCLANIIFRSRLLSEIAWPITFRYYRFFVNFGKTTGSGYEVPSLDMVTQTDVDMLTYVKTLGVMRLISCHVLRFLQPRPAQWTTHWPYLQPLVWESEANAVKNLDPKSRDWVWSTCRGALPKRQILDETDKENIGLHGYQELVIHISNGANGMATTSLAFCKVSLGTRFDSTARCFISKALFPCL